MIGYVCILLNKYDSKKQDRTFQEEMAAGEDMES